jgi:transcriptional regulator with PAS, ATPase and Fis domain
MLKEVKVDPQSIQATTLQVLREKRIMLQQQSEEVRVNLLINELVEEAVEREPMNADLYKRLMDGYITEREFIDALENVSQSLRYHLALAFLDSHNITGA